MRDDRNNERLDLVDVCAALLRRWKEILLSLLLGAVIAGVCHTCVVQPAYRASTDVYITSSDSVISLQDLQIGAALASDYQHIITSRQVLNRVIADLGLQTDYTTLKKQIVVTNPLGTHMIHTAVTTSDLILSRDIANDLLLVSIDQIYQIVGTRKPAIIDYAEAEAVENVTPPIARSMAAGGLLGAVLMVAAMLLRYIHGNAPRAADEAEPDGQPAAPDDEATAPNTPAGLGLHSDAKLEENQ